MKTLRPVSPKRARFLRKRGDYVYWKPDWYGYAWEMKYKYLNEFKYDTTVVEILGE